MTTQEFIDAIKGMTVLELNALRSSASALETASFNTFGAASTRAFASPRGLL